MGKKHFCLFQTAETGNRTLNSGVKGSGANHYPRAPALAGVVECLCELLIQSVAPVGVVAERKGAAVHRGDDNTRAEG